MFDWEPWRSRGRAALARLQIWARGFFRARLAELFAAAFVFLGVLWILALASASPLDVSLAQSGGGPVQNWLGVGGAHLANFSFQLFGDGIWAIFPGWLGYGARRMAGRNLARARLRLTAWVAAPVMLALALALWPQNPSGRLADAPSQAGGAVGQILARPLVQNLEPQLRTQTYVAPQQIWKSLSGALAALAFLLALSAGALVQRGWRWTRRCIKAIGNALWWLARALLGSAPKPPQPIRPATSPATNEVPSSSPPPPPEAPPAQPDIAPQPAAKTRITKTKSAPPKRPQHHGEFMLPPLSLLKRAPSGNAPTSQIVLDRQAEQLEAVLREFSVEGRILKVRAGPVVTLYEFEPAAGVRTARIVGLADDIARSMKALACRVAVVPGQNVIGIELPNPTRELVSLREILGAPAFADGSGTLSLALGKGIAGAPYVADLFEMPHLLVAGTTGAGKSVGINTMIMSLLYRLSPEACRLILIDPKILELSVYEGIPHLLAPVVTQPKKAIFALKWAIREMETRYQQMSELGVRNISEYNAKMGAAQARGRKIVLTRTQDDAQGKPQQIREERAPQKLPFIVIVIDEMADLMAVAGKEIEHAVQRLAQMARAAGLHLITATQRPSVDVITGTIKANFPSRISFQVTSKIDSRTILGEQGAEQLLGRGDMLVMSGGGRIQRVHGAFVSEDEVRRVVGALKAQGEPDYVHAEAITSAASEAEASGAGGGADEPDPLYTKAREAVLAEARPSISFVQRRLQIGYNRAARLIEELERAGVVSAPNTAGKRDILVKE